MTEEEYRIFVARQRIDAGYWLQDRLLEARRRYWDSWDDPIEAENRYARSMQAFRRRWITGFVVPPPSQLTKMSFVAGAAL